MAYEYSAVHRVEWVDTDMAVQGMRAGADATGVTYDEFRAGALGAVPINRIIQPEEVAHLVRFLASPEEIRAQLLTR